MRVRYLSDFDRDYRALEKYVGRGVLHGGTPPSRPDHLFELAQMSTASEAARDWYGRDSPFLTAHFPGLELGDVVVGTRYDHLCGHFIVSEVVEQLWNVQGIRPKKVANVPLIACFGYGEVDAWAARLICSDRPVIAFNYGAFLYCYLMAKAVAAVMPPADERAGGPDDGGDWFALDADLVKEYLSREPHRGVHFRDLMVAVGVASDPSASPQYWPDLSRGGIFGPLSYLMEYFVVSHEMAHVLLGHIDGSFDGQEEIMAELGLAESHYCEVTADGLALMFSMSASERVMGGSHWGFLAALLVIVGLDCVMLAKTIYADGDLGAAVRSQAETHPSGNDRILYLGEVMRRYVGAEQIEQHDHCGTELIEIMNCLVSHVSEDVEAECRRIRESAGLIE